jgi:hypothetical protein
VEALLQRFSGPAALHCESTDREERFGMAKFSYRWIGRQIDSDLSLLARVRDQSGDWQSFGSDDDREKRRAPDYFGPPGDQNVADALGRSLQRARLLAQVRELLSLLDRFGGVPNPACSELSDVELKNLTEARRIADQMSSAGSSLDSVSPGLSEHAKQLAKTPPGDGDPTISYIEAFDRVGQARFGDVWRLSLTDDDLREIEAGLWQASSASAYRSTEEKARLRQSSGDAIG